MRRSGKVRPTRRGSQRKHKSKRRQQSSLRLQSDDATRIRKKRRWETQSRRTDRGQQKNKTREHGRKKEKGKRGNSYKNERKPGQGNNKPMCNDVKLTRIQKGNTHGNQMANKSDNSESRPWRTSPHTSKEPQVQRPKKKNTRN